MEKKFLRTFNDTEVWWDEENSVVRSHTSGLVDLEIAQWFYQQTVIFGNLFEHNVNWILDMSDIIKPTAKARKTLTKAVGHESVNKYALVGASVLVRTVSNFILTAANQFNAKCFATDDEAIAWVHGED